MATQDLRKWNGKVVEISVQKLKKVRPEHIVLRNYSFTKALGVSFLSIGDLRENNENNYVHVYFRIGRPFEYLFFRFPISTLKIIKQSISLSLKRKVLSKLKKYNKLKYLDNLDYLEAYKNIKDLKVTNGH